MTQSKDPMSEVARRAEELVLTLLSLKSNIQDEDDLFEHGDLLSARTHLISAATEYFGPERAPADWQLDLGMLITQYFISTKHAVSDEQRRLAEEFVGKIEELLGEIADTPWLASIPIDRRFSSFARYVNLGPISIVNPMAEQPLNVESQRSAYIQAMKDHFGVSFMDSPEIDHAFVRGVQEIEEQSSQMIPLYPQLIVPLGHVGPWGRWRGVSRATHRYVPLVDCCVLLYDCIERNEGWPDRAPDEETCPPQGSFRIGPTLRPFVPKVLALNVRTGSAVLHSISFRGFEEVVFRSGPPHWKWEWTFGMPIDEPKFLEYWDVVALNYFRLRDAATADPKSVKPKFVEAIDRAVRLIAKSRHSLVHQLNDLVFNAVIATETILDPFGGTREGITERFALFGSALASSTAEVRRSRYDLARELYGYRCKAGHQSMLVESGHSVEFGAGHAVWFFYLCFQRIVGWACGRLDAGTRVDQAAFEEFYVETVLG